MSDPISTRLRPRQVGARQAVARTGLVAFILGSFAIGLLLMPMPIKGRLFSSLGDLAHTPLFLGLTLAALTMLERAWPTDSNRRHLFKRCLYVAAALFCFGVGMEVVQRYAGRTAAIHDVIANAMGVLIGVLAFLFWRRKTILPSSPNTLRWLFGGMIAALAVAWHGPIVSLLDDRKIRQEFPVLCSFDSKTEISRWYFRQSKAALTDMGATDGRYAMRVSLPQNRSSVTLVEMMPDWSQMDSLQIDLLLPSDQSTQTVDVAISVLDQHHANYETDLFEKTWTLRRGHPQHITIARDEILHSPLNRKMDLAQIQYVTLGLADRSAPVEIIVDAVRLTLLD